jgi:hypothetical protein
MRTENRDYYQQVLSQLEKFGLLLQTDTNFPSVCTLITDETLKGSWWYHPMARTIFQVNELLDDHPDVLITKLLSGKVTFVHRRLWPELYAAANSKETWQTDNLSAEAREVLKSVQKKELVRSDEIRLSKTPAKTGHAVRQLEQRLLVQAHQVHTESGKHAKMLETWDHWAAGAGLGSPDTPAIDAIRTFEQIVQKLNKKFDGNAMLPWRPLK